MYHHVKLVNGDDIICVLPSNQPQGGLRMQNPVKIVIDPYDGVMCQVWNTLTEGEMIAISIEHVLYKGKASQRASEYYEEFFRQLQQPSQQEVDELEAEFGPVIPKKGQLLH